MPPESPVKPGDVLGQKYRVERVLGVGGMGMVVAAKHIELGQRVALKFMLAEGLKDREQVERFQREARAAVQLKSEHAAKVTDVGKLKNGAPFMVMEYLEGQDLGAVLQQQGALSPQLAIEFILQTAEAIAEAHALGIVHRDIKPKNLFLTRRVDGRPLVKVLDFGLAKTGITGAPIGLTQTAAVFGSPQYMSPEQMRSAKDVDFRSDIWALGVCLYELLTGNVPFDAPTLPELCAMVLKDPPRPIEQVRPDIPPELANVIYRCLQKDPNLRFQNIGEFARELERFAAPHSVGSADRILTVLAQTRPLKGDSLTSVASAADAYNDPISATRTAAVFDSIQEKPRSKVALISGIAAISTVMAVSVVFIAMKVASKSATATVSSSASAATLAPPPAATAVGGATEPPSVNVAPAATVAVSAPPTANTGATAFANPPAAPLGANTGGAKQTTPPHPPGTAKTTAPKPTATTTATAPTATATATATPTATSTTAPTAPPKPTSTAADFNKL
jgi:serine/threonine-protein kinase